jgi:hypothetical protein
METDADVGLREACHVGDLAKSKPIELQHDEGAVRRGQPVNGGIQPSSPSELTKQALPRYGCPQGSALERGFRGSMHARIHSIR